MIIELTAEPELMMSPEEVEERDGASPGFAEAVREVESSAKAPWGWCTVVVTVVKDGRAATTALGQCSYRDEADFIKNSGQFDTMVREALDELRPSFPEGVTVHTPGSTIRIVDGQILKD